MYVLSELHSSVVGHSKCGGSVVVECVHVRKLVKLVIYFIMINIS